MTIERQVIILRLQAGDWVASRAGHGEPIVAGPSLARCRAALRRSLRAETGESVPWDEQVELPVDLEAIVAEARRQRESALEQQRRSLQATQLAVFRLADSLAGKVGMRDIARLVGVSHQRVQQVLSSHPSGDHR